MAELVVVRATAKGSWASDVSHASPTIRPAAWLGWGCTRGYATLEAEKHDNLHEQASSAHTRALVVCRWSVDLPSGFGSDDNGSKRGGKRSHLSAIECASWVHDLECSHAERRAGNGSGKGATCIPTLLWPHLQSSGLLVVVDASHLLGGRE